MPDLSQIIQASAAHAWLYLPLAVVLGALHALEPGHAKSLMAAYIVSIRGSSRQAALLGLSAAVGHTIVVWALAIIGLLLGEKLIVEQAEPWLALLSGIGFTVSLLIAELAYADQPERLADAKIAILLASLVAALLAAVVLQVRDRTYRRTAQVDTSG